MALDRIVKVLGISMEELFDEENIAQNSSEDLHSQKSTNNHATKDDIVILQSNIEKMIANQKKTTG
jgi:hypothetical protein